MLYQFRRAFLACHCSHGGHSLLVPKSPFSFSTTVMVWQLLIQFRFSFLRCDYSHGAVMEGEWFINGSGVRRSGCFGLFVWEVWQAYNEAMAEESYSWDGIECFEGNTLWRLRLFEINALLDFSSSLDWAIRKVFMDVERSLALRGVRIMHTTAGSVLGERRIPWADEHGRSQLEDMNRVIPPCLQGSTVTMFS